MQRKGMDHRRSIIKMGFGQEKIETMPPERTEKDECTKFLIHYNFFTSYP